MAFFEDLGKKISQTSQGVLQKTKDSAEILKLNGMVSDETKKINGLYAEIGKKYFEIHSDSPEEALENLVSQVKDSQKKIDDYSEQVKKLKGVTKCHNCGGDVQYGSPFCTNCGARLTVPEAEVEAAPAVDPNAKICAKCGKAVNGDSAFCIFCGAKLEEAPVEAPVEENAPAEAPETNVRVCPNCNFEITDDSLFCVKCGTKL